MKSSGKRRWIWLLAALALVAGGFVGIRAVLAHKHSRAASAAAEKAKKKQKARDAKRRPAQSVIVRSGLPNLRQKLEAGNPVTIGFIGGSITYNAGHGGFVSEVPGWLKKRYPGSEIKVINAGISATGSDFGAQRVDRDILEFRPDLVFIEFAVNDAGCKRQADMERLVRKIRMADPAPEIVMIYSISSDTLPKLERGEFPDSVKQHEAVAAHYDVPTVAFGYDLAEKIHRGEWKWADFSADACHPTDKGYESYDREIDLALESLLAAGTAGPKPLPATLTPKLSAYPPPAIAEPPAAPKPMADPQEVTAVRTDEAPLFGVQWIGAPGFPAGPEPVWQLQYRPYAPGTILDATAGLDRGDWKPQRWFEEARSFTGRASQPLAWSTREGGNFFGSTLLDQSVLMWRAPAVGRCIVEVSALDVQGSGISPQTMAGVNIVLFPQGATRGESVAFESGHSGDPLKLRSTLRVSPGDLVAVVFQAAQCKFAFYRQFSVRAGLFAE